MAPWIARKLGNREEYGIDYDETFASVANMTTVRIIPARGFSHMASLSDACKEYISSYGDVKEEFYMCPPPGHVLSSTGHVCWLWRSLYGLKQTPRAWFEKF